jgi:predicted flap endonuclease-1-like 5' DNA nuclease
MAKAKDNLTPAQRAVIKSVAESALLRKAAGDFAKAAENAAELEKARKTIDRAQAIRDGLNPPPRATKPEKLGPKERRIIPLLRERWPPDGIAPANFDKLTAIKGIGDAFQKRHREEVTRNTILRVIARHILRHARR